MCIYTYIYIHIYIYIYILHVIYGMLFSCWLKERFMICLQSWWECDIGMVWCWADSGAWFSGSSFEPIEPQRRTKPELSRPSSTAISEKCSQYLCLHLSIYIHIYIYIYTCLFIHYIYTSVNINIYICIRIVLTSYTIYNQIKRHQTFSWEDMDPSPQSRQEQADKLRGFLRGERIDDTVPITEDAWWGFGWAI